MDLLLVTWGAIGSLYVLIVSRQVTSQTDPLAWRSRLIWSTRWAYPVMFVVGLSWWIVRYLR